MATGGEKFAGGYLFAEGLLSIRQDKNSPEFQAVKIGHGNFPEYNLEEIRSYIYRNYMSTTNNKKSGV